jgi:hypothetical protein
MLAYSQVLLSIWNADYFLFLSAAPDANQGYADMAATRKSRGFAARLTLLAVSRMSDEVSVVVLYMASSGLPNGLVHCDRPRAAHRDRDCASIVA